MRLVAENLSWSAGSNTIVQDVSLTVSPGSFFGILGPNGSGKSTALQALAGLIVPSEGRAEIDGVAVWIWGPQFEVWKETQLILDVVPGRGGAFSLDNGRERRFLTRARLFSAEELARLDPVTVGS